MHEKIIEEEDPYSTDILEIECPYCGNKNDFSGVDSDLYSEDDHEVCCKKCNKDFFVITYISYSFTSLRKNGVDYENTR
jgi:hypothetical protein